MTRRPKQIRRLHPDGIQLSNGPGDPKDVPHAVKMIPELLGEYPIFGICLGHQLFALACGADTSKLKFGHRGGNHPVKELATEPLLHHFAEPWLHGAGRIRGRHEAGSDAYQQQRPDDRRA